MRTTNNELTCWIYKVFDIIVEESQHLIAQVCLDTWNQDIEHILTNLSQHSLIVILTIVLLDEIIMLGRNNDGIDALWNIIIRVLDSNLTLGVWTKISHHLAFLTDISKYSHDELCQAK